MTPVLFHWQPERNPVRCICGGVFSKSLIAEREQDVTCPKCVKLMAAEVERKLTGKAPMPRCANGSRRHSWMYTRPVNGGPAHMWCHTCGASK